MYQKFIKATYIVVLLVFISSYSIRPIQANSIEPSINTFNISAGKTMDSKVTYHNSESSVMNITVSASAYDPENKSETDGNIYISFKKTDYAIQPNSDQEIPYTITIPSDTAPKTAFNMILMVEDKESNTSISITSGFGALVVMNISNDERTLSEEFISKANSTIEIIDKGIPFIKPMKIKYTFTNNSNLVIIPNGITTISRSDRNISPIKFALNPDGNKVYPGKSITIEKEINVNDFMDIFYSYNIEARTTSQFGDTELIATNKVSYIEYAIIGFISLLVFIALIIYLRIDKKQKLTNKPKDSKSSL